MCMGMATHRIQFHPDTIPALLQHRASRCSRDVAYSYPELGQHATWLALWEDVRSTAKGFLALGIEKGDRIAILMQGRLELIVTLFAAMSLGAVAVPVNAYSKKDEFAACLRDARPKALVLGSEGHHLQYPALMKEILSDAGAEGRESGWLPDYVFVTDKPEAIEPPFLPYASLALLGASTSDRTFVEACQQVEIQDPAVLLYTSATLGQPKGVLRTLASFLPKGSGLKQPSSGKEALLRLADRIARRFSLMNLLPLYHLGGFAVLITNLKSVNVRVVLLTRFNPVHALQAVERERCRILTGTPFMIQHMLAANREHRRDLSSLLGVAFTSAAVNNRILQRVMNELDLLFFLVSYGSSEAGSVANGTCFLERRNSQVLRLLYRLLEGSGLLSGTVRRSDFENTAYSLAGKIDKGVRVKVADPDSGEELPQGQQGEILIKSHRVMRYTREHPGRACYTREGWFRSGDLGYFDERGYLTITGRMNRLISRGGEKISPAEIEHALLAHPGVEEAMVLGIPDDLYGEQICACVVARPGAELSPEKLGLDLERRLSAFKLPRYYVFLPQLPLSATGKNSVAEIRELALGDIGGLRKNA